MAKVQELSRPAVRGPKRKNSNFFVTINTNRPDYDRERFRDVLHRLFSDDVMFYQLFDGNTSTVDKENATVEFAIEAGPNNGKVHAHALISLQHSSILKMRLKILREVLEKALGIDGVYVNVVGTGDTQKNLRDYLQKV